MHATTSPWIFDTTDAAFQQEVLERSKQTPVIVDLWAPWCGPCRALGPILEKAVQDAGGAVLLARLNTDENQEIAMQLEVRGIPDVRAFRGGVEVDRFVGLQPKPAIEDFVRRLVPSQAQNLAAQAQQALAEGRLEQAVADFRTARELEPRNLQVRLGLSLALSELGKDEEAGQLLQDIHEGDEGWEAAQALRLRLELRRLSKEAGGLEAAEARAKETPGDPGALYNLAAARFTEGDTRGALESLLELVRRDRRWNDDAGKKTMVRIFDLIGSRSPLSDEYRVKLSRTLY